jgi:KDO2-lipid IV(A) lauroyltransferase
MQRVKRGHYDLSFIPICDDASKMTPEELIRKYYDMLEAEIRETPANWLWSHKRWK